MNTFPSAANRHARCDIRNTTVSIERLAPQRDCDMKNETTAPRLLRLLSLLSDCACKET